MTAIGNAQGRGGIPVSTTGLVVALNQTITANGGGGSSETLDGLAETVSRGRDAGLAGFSIEDWDPRRGRLYEAAEAAERVAAVVQAARQGGEPNRQTRIIHDSLTLSFEG